MLPWEHKAGRQGDVFKEAGHVFSFKAIIQLPVVFTAALNIMRVK